MGCLKLQFLIDDNLATPYGERSDLRSDVNKVMDFTLKAFDRELDAVRMGHRYYDPSRCCSLRV